MKSSVFGWQYELDSTVPVITTKDEIMSTAEAYNQTVGIELVGGEMMMVDRRCPLAMFLALWNGFEDQDKDLSSTFAQSPHATIQTDKS